MRLLEGIFHSIRKSYSKYISIAIQLTLCCMLLMMLVPAEAKAADHKISIKTELGLNPYTNSKLNRMNPVRVELTSDTADISGDLVIQIGTMNTKDVSYVQHVELPKGVTKELIFNLPGGIYSKDNNSVRFYQDSVESGRVIPFATGAESLFSSSFSGGTVAVLSGDKDTFNFLSLLNQQRYSLEVFPISIDRLPASANMLDAIDVLAINQFPSETLSNAQIEAITNWVNNGGTLILSGGAGFAKTASPFQKLLPVEFEGTTSIQNLSSLAEFTGKELQLTDPFTLSLAKPLPESEVILKQDEIPLVVSKSFGTGKVIYAAYDVALQPVSNWNGHSLMWGDILQDKLKEYNQQNGMYYRGDPDWMLNNALDYFPSIQSPPFGMLAILLVIYAIIVAPLLYLILKKFDKREWSWVIIPSIAVLSSFVIYFVGAKDKTAIVSHTISTIELDGKGQGKRSGGTALFAPGSGNYTLSIDKMTTPLPFYSLNNSLQNLRGETELYIRSEADTNVIEFMKVPFWSVRKTLLQDTGSKPLGALTGDLSITAAGTLEGKITNNTESDLQDAFVVYGNQYISLGEIKRKDTVSVLLQANQGPTNSVYSDIGYMIYPYTSQNDDKERQRQLVNYYANKNMLSNYDPIFLAWSNDQGFDYLVDGKTIRNDQLTMWTQELKLSVVHGQQITIPMGYIKPEVSEVNSQGYTSDGRMQMLNMKDGYVVVDYMLPKVEGAKYSELTIDYVQGNVTAEAWNYEENKWEPVYLNSPLKLDRAALVPYIDNGKKIQLKLTVATGGDVVFPGIALKGEVTP
ncbi:hypothetical protein E0485_20840 [Paenibacillus albiflavus]|uniref:DUF7408 domain-containing protein n=1 Tax=Paenibacillus albiflavus TaxID=2545760 RepID=A0A4R4E3Q0_9BACL|nr:hypothetical protein [Paenibacillus albiflavus]TCZ73557.1 hypothetical protein E0485_20840 [Paenibacillus albiflavus]